MKKLLLAVLSTAVVAVPVRAQVSRLDGRIDASTRQRIAIIVDSAASVGLPTGSLISKALEGASKGADSERIVVAVRGLAGELGEARRALGARSTPLEVEAGAAAVHAGVSVASLQRLRAGRTSLEVALAVMTDLIARGVSADTAAIAVIAMSSVRARDAELVALRRNVERDIALGALPSAATAASVNKFAEHSLLTASAQAAPGSKPKP